MKKHFSILVLMALFLSLISTSADARIKVSFGTKSHPDSTGYCGGDKGICIIIDIGRYSGGEVYGLGDAMGVANIGLTDDGDLKMEILYDSEKENKGDYFIVEKDVPLNEEICKELEVSSLSIKAGKYLVDYSQFENGSVILNTSK